MWIEYWLIMFSTACLSNLVGLNISSAFNSAKVIYIIIPLMIIPQLLFSGVIVKFDKLHPSLSNATKVPWVGNMMASRWAYEALAVQQIAENEYESYFLKDRIKKAEAEWRKDFWVPEIQKNMEIILDTSYAKEDREYSVELLKNEIEKADDYWGNLNCKGCSADLKKGINMQQEDFANIDLFLNYIRVHSNGTANKQRESIEMIIDSLGVNTYMALQQNYSNEALLNITTNKAESKKLIVSDNEIFQNDNPIYFRPKAQSFFDSHYYAPYKYLFGYELKTFNANLVILWLISIFTYIALYYDILKKFLDGTQRIWERIFTRTRKKFAD